MSGERVTLGLEKGLNNVATRLGHQSERGWMNTNSRGQGQSANFVSTWST